MPLMGAELDELDGRLLVVAFLLLLWLLLPAIPGCWEDILLAAVQLQDKHLRPAPLANTPHHIIPRSLYI